MLQLNAGLRCAAGTHRLTLKTVWHDPHVLAQQLAAVQDGISTEQYRNLATEANEPTAARVDPAGAVNNPQ